MARGDRRVAAVIRRAWELGATNDAWWASGDQCHAAWSQAIEECGMSWKYRQVGCGMGGWEVGRVGGGARSTCQRHCKRARAHVPPRLPVCRRWTLASGM